MSKKVKAKQEVTAVKKKAVVKKTVKKSVAKKKAPAMPKLSIKKKEKVVLHANDVHEKLPKIHHVCRSCNALPVGSIELVSLLLVLVFALSAVLITSVYALDQRSQEISSLQAQVVQMQVE